MHACVHAWNDIAVFGLHLKKDVIDCCCCCEGNQVNKAMAKKENLGAILLSEKNGNKFTINMT